MSICGPSLLTSSTLPSPASPGSTVSSPPHPNESARTEKMDPKAKRASRARMTRSYSARSVSRRRSTATTRSHHASDEHQDRDSGGGSAHGEEAARLVARWNEGRLDEADTA